VRVTTDQHVYVCRSLQISIATYPLTRIILVVIFRSSEMNCDSDSGTSICWLQRCIQIVFLKCNLTWKTEQLTNNKCSLIQYGDENDSEVLVQNFIENWALFHFIMLFILFCITIYSLLFEKAAQWTLFTSFFARRRHSV
jgi:hypothetical protein